MTTVGFIGLGIMGAPMARNLVAAGFDVRGHNRSAPALQRLAEAGGHPAGSVAEAVTGADVVITMLPDSPDVQAVVLGEDGVFAHAEPGALVVDMSTITPAVARDLAEQGGRRELRVLDAPVSGGEKGAIDGTLSIMVGGAAEHVEAARPVFEVLGGTVVHVGPAGAGQTVKAANQLVVAGTMQLVAEAVGFLDAHGLDTAAALRVLAGGLAGSKVLEQKAQGMVARSFQPGFRAELHHKDLGIMTAAARESGANVPLGALTAQLMAALVAQGHGELDHSALLLLVDQLSGRAQR